MLLLRPNFDGADGQRLPCLTRHCSRQCRRTRRLRAIPANARVIREGRLTGAAEYRAGHAVARCDAVPASSVGDHFEHGANRTGGGDEAVREPLGAFRDAQDAAVPGDENDR